MKKKRTTLRDLAQHTGFSISTISHVINGTRFVEKTTKEAIFSAIHALGYKKETNSNRKHQFIGVIIPDIRVSYFTDLLKYLEELSLSWNYHILYFDSEENPKKELEFFSKLLELQVVGIIIAPCDYKAILPATDIPVVCVDRKLQNTAYSFVSIDHFESAYKATEFLLKNDILKAGFIGFSEKNFTSKERKRGFEFALQTCPDPIIFSSYLVDYHELKLGKDFYNFLMNLGPKAGILASSSNLAFKIVGACREMNLRIPEDLCLVAYDNDKWFDFLAIPISVVEQPIGDIAAVVIEKLVQMIESPSSKVIKQDILLPYQFIIRQ